MLVTLAAGGLKPADSVRLADRKPDRTVTLKLTDGMDRYDWAFNGKPDDPKRIEAVRSGERVRVDYVNTTEAGMRTLLGYQR